MGFEEKINITLGIIVKNEEDRIEKILETVCKFVKEVIVVDNGSTDKTLQIAYKHTKNIYSFPEYKESQLRNVYIENASCPWIMTLDADEEVELKFWDKLKERLEHVDSEVVSFIVPIYSYYGDGLWSHFTTHRIFRNINDLRYSGDIHPSITKNIYNKNLKYELFESPIHHLDALLKKRCKAKRDLYIERIKKELNSVPDEQHKYRLLCYLAVEYVAKRKYIKAINILNELILSENPFTNIAKLYLVQVYVEMQDLKNADKIIMKICNKYNDLLTNCDSKKIIECFKNNSNFSDEFLQRLFVSISQICIYKEDRDKALEFAKAGLILYPFASQHYLNVASLTKDNDQKNRWIELAKRYNSYILNKIIFEQGEQENIYRFQSSLLSTVKELNLNK